MSQSDWVPIGHIIDVAIWLAFIAGWFLIIAFLINSNESTGLLIARGFGIVVPPLGSILGLIGIFI